MTQSLLQGVPYIVELAGACVLLLMVLEIQRRRHETEQRWNKRQMLLQSEIGKLRSELTALQARVQEAEMRSELDTTAPPRLSGLNVNRRSQAIRLLRRGERPEHVSATLGMPAAETDLLLKVYRIVMTREVKRTEEP